MSNTLLRNAIRIALRNYAVAGASIALGSAASGAAAQTADQGADQKSQSLETIVVTGSNIRRVDIETANPVVTIDAAAIQNTGKLTLGDIVQSLPANMNGTNPQVNNGGGSGSATVSLRGLGAIRTLVLIDGHIVLNRDIDAIPIAAVERVEILTSGASAIYGSSAIGGVVNVILKHNYQGAQFSADYGISDHDDGQRRGMHFLFGHNSDKGSLMAGIDYNKQDSVLQSHRKFSQDAKSLYGTNGLGPSAPQPINYDPPPGGSTFGPNGNIRIPSSGPLFDHYGCTTLAHTPGTSGANALTDYHCFVNNGTASTPSDKYNYAAVNLLMTPQERTAVFVNGTYHLTDNVDVYLNGVHNKTQSGFQLAPSLLGTEFGAVISADSIYNPFGPYGVHFESGNGGYRFRERLVAAGFRATRSNNTTDQFSAGFKGHFGVFDQDWNWELGSDYGHISTVIATLGLPNVEKLNVAMGPSMIDPNSRQPICVTTPGDASTAIPGCVPFNPFNPYTPDQQAILATIAAPALTNLWTQERIHHLDFNGGVFNLPAGTAQLAIGGSYRKEYQNNTVAADLTINPATGNCTLGSQCTSHLQGGYNVKEAYGELFLPILKDLPFANSLNVTVSDRWSKYSTFGSTNNAALGVEYRPIADLLLRGNYNKVFRAPTVANVYAPPASDAPRLNHDPCDHFTGAPAGSGPALACAGVPTDGTFVDQDAVTGQQIKGIASGALYAGFPIKAEHGSTLNWGFVYSPHWVEGLSLSTDVWRVKLDDTITAPVGAQQVLDSCFAGNLAYCPLIFRKSGANNPDQGQIDHIIEPTGNVGSIDVRGADFSIKYRLPQFGFGQFTTALDATYLARYNQDPNPGSGLIYHNAGHVLPFGSGQFAACPDGASGVCLMPRWRALASVTWNLGPWDASWRMRYIGKFRMGSARPDEDTFPAGQCYYGSYCSVHGLQLHYGARTYNDVQAGYNIEAINTRIDVGIDNVGDIQPPFLYANNSLNANTDTANFDTLGRYYFARVTVKF